MRTAPATVLLMAAALAVCLTWRSTASSDPAAPALAGSVLAAPGASGVEQELIATILASYEYLKEHKTSNPEDYPRDGALEFWSSGGLIHRIEPGGPGERYTYFNVVPSDIKVVAHSDTVATVLFYAEGSFKPKGYPAVSNYLVRVTQTYVKENDRWVTPVSHWSPILGGSGTSQTAVD